MKTLSDVMAEAIDYGRHSMDSIVVLKDHEEFRCVKVDGWIDADDIKRAYKAIIDFENQEKAK